MKKKPRAWQRMLSGRRLDILNPDPTDIEIEDIAHGLAFVARWNGQTIGDYPYSVAEHSILVESIYSKGHPDGNPRWNLAALLHDASEYVIGDMISPVKCALGPEYNNLEAGLSSAVLMRFGLPIKLPPEVQNAIKSADRHSAWLESVQIAGFEMVEADRHFLRPIEPSIANIKIQPLPAKIAKSAFIDRFNVLIDQIY